MIEAISDQLASLPRLMAGHIVLTVFSVLVGTAISVGLGIFVSRYKALQGSVLGVAGVIQTIPGLAMLAIMFPIFGRIGFLPAFAALVLYSMLPVLRNTVIGIAEVDAAVIEAARGVGMTDRQQLLRVELPLAAPVIIGGIRTATVWTVGMATLATPIGADSLGEYIFSGLQTRSNATVVLGCVAAALLAIVLDGVIRMLEVGVQRRKRVLVAAALLVLTGVTAAACVQRYRSGAGLSRERVVRIGAKTFSEQYILADLIARQIRDTTDYMPVVRGSLGSTVAFDALRLGEIDVYVDYTGTIWATVFKRTDRMPRDEMTDEVKRILESDYGVEVIGPLGFENAYRFAMRGDAAQRRGIRTTTELIRQAPSLRFGTDVEFVERDEYKSLVHDHELNFGEVRTMQSALMYQAVDAGQIDVITAYTTDGHITALDLALIEDDIHAFPPYDAIILVSRKSLETKPELKAALAPLVDSINNEQMMTANWEVDEKHESPSRVAASLLERLRAAGSP